MAKYLSGANQHDHAEPAATSDAVAGKRTMTQDLPVQRKAAPAASVDGGDTATAGPAAEVTDPFSLHLPVQRKAIQRQAAAAEAGAQPDPNEVELKTKVAALAASKFGGDYRKAFDHYDTDNDGAISKDELMKLLSDAGVGNGLTRGAWAKGVIGKMDKSGDGKIQWAEFEAATRG